MKTSVVVVGVVVLAGAVFAQSSTNAPVRLPEITVVAEKEPAGAQSVPVSVTAVTTDTIRAADVGVVGAAAVYAPNVHLTEFTTRALSIPSVRGLSGSPGNAAVTTYYDGVPQLHAYSSNVEWVDVEQAEFVRGAQGMLYGRNTLGGAINVLSRLPSSQWEGAVEGGLGNYNAWAGRFRASGPLVAGQLGLSIAGGSASRDGFTKNDFTGHDLDHREAFFGKLQLQWMPVETWSVRFILSGERDRDGDYALGDLAAIRANPHHVQQDFEGFADRDVVMPTLVVERHGEKVNFTFITGLVWWKLEQMTDLDYSIFQTVPGMSMLTREARHEDTQFTQEFRLASPADAPVVLLDALKLKWQAGLLFFTQNYKEDSITEFAPFALTNAIPFTVDQTSPQARLDDIGIGGYAQTTFIAWDKLELGLGVRADYERKVADIQTFYTPTIAPGTAVDTDADFTHVSPQFSVAWHVVPGKTLYGVISHGYRAGGFNPDSPLGKTAYDKETSWHYEIGAKTAWWDDRFTANLALFYIDWQDLQLNLLNGRNYYVANAGAANSKGVELELNLRPVRGWDIFGGAGYTDGHFNSGAMSMGPVGGNRLVFTPDFTANAGTQLSVELHPQVIAYARAEVIGTGKYYYDAANTASQDAYWLANFRVGLRLKHGFIEGWIKNAFDQNYVPVALAYPSASGFLGESGAPVTFGVRAGLGF